MAIHSERITVENTFEDVVKLDREKKLIRFADEVNLFLEITPGQLNQLSERTQTSWRLAKEAYEERKASQEEPNIAEWIERVTVGVNRGQARTRLRIDNKQKGWAYKWQNPRDAWVKENQFGWQRVVGGPERTLANASGVGPHVIGDKGEEELVLMRRPLAVHEAWEKAQTEKHNRRAGDLREHYQEEIERKGYRAFDPDNEKEPLNKSKSSSNVVLSGDKE